MKNVSYLLRKKILQRDELITFLHPLQVMVVHNLHHQTSSLIRHHNKHVQAATFQPYSLAENNIRFILRVVGSQIYRMLIIYSTLYLTKHSNFDDSYFDYFMEIGISKQLMHDTIIL